MGKSFSCAQSRNEASLANHTLPEFRNANRRYSISQQHEQLLQLEREKEELARELEEEREKNKHQSDILKQHLYSLRTELDNLREDHELTTDVWGNEMDTFNQEFNNTLHLIVSKVSMEPVRQQTLLKTIETWEEESSDEEIKETEENNGKHELVRVGSMKNWDRDRVKDTGKQMLKELRRMSKQSGVNLTSDLYRTFDKRGGDSALSSVTSAGIEETTKNGFDIVYESEDDEEDEVSDLSDDGAAEVNAAKNGEHRRRSSLISQETAKTWRLESIDREHEEMATALNDLIMRDA